MVKELEVVNIIPRILSIGEIAKELFKEINKISDNEIILNFKGVEYMCVFLCSGIWTSEKII